MAAEVDAVLIEPPLQLRPARGATALESVHLFKEITLVIPLASRGARPERVVAGRVRKIGKRTEGA